MSRPEYLRQIENRIRSLPEGSAFVAADFLDLADTPAINKALSRLSAEGTIRRIVHGVYDRPGYSELLREQAAPDMGQAAKAIARNFGWTIVPGGDTALNLLGLSAQVPAVWQYVSDGPYREYRIGKRVLRFKHGANKDISGLTEQFALIVQALKALGKDNIDDAALQKLASVLRQEERLAFLQDTQHRTAWIHRVAKELFAMGQE